ncbi:MAG TPA: protein kinase [Candidatus Nitrosotenuis sp.]|nr:protein kinase [Candidatus Nitrosotenuis sp.]
MKTMIGQTIAHYRVSEKLGAGGMGEVYRARDSKLNRDVALKVLPASTMADPAARERLLREARTASQLNHPNICTIHEVSDEAGQSFIAMELVEGQPLSARISGEGLPAEQVIRYGAQIADALAHAHERGVVHRDLKSANVMISSEGRVKVLDFGLAVRRQEDLEEATRSRVSLEQEKGVAGTLPYIAPEILRGAPADARSDLWALGVMLYEMCSGRLPFRGSTGFDLTSAILRDALPPLPVSLPPALYLVIQKCLAKDPAQRYQRAGEVRAALEMITPQPGAAVPLDAGAGTKAPRKLPWTVYAGLAAVGLAAALFALDVGGIRSRLAGAPPGDEIHSLAVLPLKISGEEKGDDVLGIGMADTIITKVSQSNALIVRPISAVRKYAALDVDALEAGRQLQADSVLDGTVQRSRDRLRINLNLLRVRDGASLWSNNFDEQAGDVFALQDKISEQVSGALRLKLSPSEQVRFRKRYTSNPEAYEFYLKGMRSYDRRGVIKNSAPVLLEAMEMLRQAIALDPNYALARAQLASVYAYMGVLLEPDGPWIDLAHEQLRRAEALDPELPQIHVARYELLWSAQEGFRLAEAARELRIAAQLDPNAGQGELGLLYAHIGLEAAAIREADKALQIDPASETVQWRYVEVRDLLGLADEAIAAHHRFGDRLTASYSVRKAYLWKQDWSMARRINDYVLSLSPREPFVRSNSLLLAALQGDFGPYEREKLEIIAAARNSRAYHHVTYNFAAICALQNKPKQAVEWLQETVDKGMPNYTLFSRDPHLDPIRKDPAFVDFMKRLKVRWDEFDREFGK